MVYIEPKMNKNKKKKGQPRFSRMPKAWFEDKEKQSAIAYFRPITKNEYNAVVRNRIADRRCANQVKLLSSESKTVCSVISRRIFDSQKFISELQRSTGYLSAEHRSNSTPSRRMRSE